MATFEAHSWVWVPSEEDLVLPAKALSRFKAGESVTSIAGRLNVSKQYIRRLVSDLQTSTPRVPWRLMLAAVAVVVRTHGANFARLWCLRTIAAGSA